MPPDIDCSIPLVKILRDLIPRNVKFGAMRVAIELLKVVEKFSFMSASSARKLTIHSST